jgi:hypothetical protein
MANQNNLTNNDGFTDFNNDEMIKSLISKDGKANNSGEPDEEEARKFG